MQELDGARARAGAVIRPVGGDGVVDVGELEDLRRHRELAALEPVGIPAAVELLVVPADDRQEVAQALERLADALPDDGVLVHHDPLLVGQPARLVDDLVRDPDLADVVQDAALPQGLAGVLVEAGEPPPLDGQGSHALGVTLGVRVLGLDGVRQREDHLGGVLEALGGQPGAQRRSDAGVELGPGGRKADHVIGSRVERGHDVVLARIRAGDQRKEPRACGALDAPADRAPRSRRSAEVDHRERRLGRQERFGRRVHGVCLDQREVAAQRPCDGFAKCDVTGDQDRDCHAKSERNTHYDPRPTQDEPSG